MTAVAAFELTSTATQAAAPFVIGHTFAEGAIPAGEYAHIDNLANFAVVPLNAWNDGSLKFAMLVGRAALTADIPFQVNIVKRAFAPTVGTALTAATIVAAAPTASIQFGANGTATLAGLGSPKRTWYSTKEVVCCEYVAMAGSDPHLWAQFFVWVFADGRRFTRAVANNGFFMGGAGQRNYVPTVTIDGVMVYNKGGAIYYHSQAATWDVTYWTGIDPQITPRHDTGKLMASKMVPNYSRTNTSSAITTYLALVSGYTPGARLGYAEAMGGTGFQDHIGVLAQWEGQYFVTRGSKEAYNAVLDNGRAIRSYAISFPDSTTLDPIKLADYPTHTLSGPGGGGQTQVGSIAQDGVTSLIWEIAHHPSAGYLPYLLTADPYFMQTCQYQAKLCFLVQTSGSGSGVTRDMTGQARGRAWSWRTIAQAAASCPDSLVAVYGDNKTWFGNQMTAQNTHYAPLASGFLGMVDMYENYLGAGQAADGSNCAGISFWQHDFILGALGHALDIQPCASMADTLTFCRYVGKSSVWRLGPPNDANSYCFTYATAQFFLSVPKSTPLGDPAPITAAQAIPNNAGEIFLHTNGAVSTTDNLLKGTSGGDPVYSSGQWGQVMMGVTAAIDYGVTGALAGYSRILGAANYSTTQGVADYDFTPNFGMVARSVSQQSNTFTPVDLGAPVPTPGPSIIMDSVSFLASGIVMDTNRGLGILAGAIPTGFAQPHPLENDVDVGDPVGTEYAYEVTTPPAGLTSFLINQDGSIVATGPDGLHVGVQTTKKNGVWTTGVPLNVQIGEAGTVTGVSISPTTATGSTDFDATVSGTGSFSTAKEFSKISGGGSIDPSTGVFTPPAQTGSIQAIVVRATSTQDPTKWAEAVITIAALVVSRAPRFARPESDVSAGSWVPSSGSSLFAMLDEATADSSDYISTTSASTAVVSLAPVVDPGTSVNQVVRYQAWAPTGGALTVRLKQGSTVIASWSHSPLPTTPTIFAQSLTGPECDSITDYTLLQLEFVAAP